MKIVVIFGALLLRWLMAPLVIPVFAVIWLFGGSFKCADAWEKINENF